MQVKLPSGRVATVTHWGGKTVHLMVHGHGPIFARKYDRPEDDRALTLDYSYRDVRVDSTLATSGDLEVTLANDADVYLYEGIGDPYLDWSPQTLGYKILD